MKKFAAVFPGQGSQSVGMLASLMEEPAAAEVYAEANAVLGYDLKALTLNGPAEQLNQTEVTQPAILAASVAAWRVLQQKIKAMPQAVAGHSLGEYSALVVAGCLELADALRLTRLRGQAMQAAVPAGTGAMAAVLGLEDGVVEEICSKICAAGSKVWAANFNAPGQVVISGSKAGVDAACVELKNAGARKVVPLAVSAPSHCPLMGPAADKLQEALANISLKNAAIPVYSNVSAQPETNKDVIIKSLIAQLTCPVQWVKTVQNLKAAGCEILVECGPNKVLTGLNRRIDRTLSGANVLDAASLDKTVSLLNE